MIIEFVPAIIAKTAAGGNHFVVIVRRRKGGRGVFACDASRRHSDCVVDLPPQNRYTDAMGKVIHARFYRMDSSGLEPVREWVHTLSPAERQKIGKTIRLVELGWPIGMPICRSLGDGIFEVRINLDKRIARVLFCIAAGEMWLLHGFIKTTQKTPVRDMHLARQRKSELLGGGS